MGCVHAVWDSDGASVRADSGSVGLTVAVSGFSLDAYNFPVTPQTQHAVVQTSALPPSLVSDLSLTVVETIKKDPAEYWQKKAVDSAGPMGMWDAIAQKLENLLERTQGKSGS